MFRKPTVLCVIATVCLLVAGLGFKSSSEPPWVEIVAEGVLRANSPPGILATARMAVIERHQFLVPGPDGVLADPSSQRSGQCWKSDASRDRLRTEVSRARAQVTDQNGKTLAIEQVAASGAPTLIFIAYDGPGGPAQIANELVSQFERRGIFARN